MGIVVDLIIIVIALLFIFLGYKKGLTGSLIKLLSFVIALILTFMLYKPVANLVMENTEIYNNIKTTITNTIGEKEENNKNESNQISNLIENAAEDVKSELIEETTKTIINVGVAILLYVAIRIILLIISLFVSQVTKLPIIKQVDKIGGVAYGALEGIVIIYIILGLISLSSVIWPDNILVEAIIKSTLGNMLYNNNIILNLFFK